MLRASGQRTLHQTVERKPHRNPISEVNNTGGESDKSDMAHWEGLKHASDADETSKRRIFDGVCAHFRPPVATMPDVRDGYRQNSRSPNEPPAYSEAGAPLVSEGKTRYAFRQFKDGYRNKGSKKMISLLSFLNAHLKILQAISAICPSMLTAPQTKKAPCRRSIPAGRKLNNLECSL